MQNFIPIKIIVAIKFKLFKESLIFLINSMENLLIVDEAEDGIELISKCKKHPSDIVLIDFELEDLNQTINTIKKENNEIKFIILFNEKHKIQIDNIKKVCSGFVSKNCNYNELYLEILRVINGGGMNNFNSNKKDNLTKNQIKNIPNEIKDLTRRENDILLYISRGLTSKEIADKLFISVRTVDSHRSKIIQKYNLHNSSELFHFAYEFTKNNYKLNEEKF